MAVVINEFEVVPQPTQNQPAASAAAPSTATPPMGPTAQDIERIIQHQRERLARVRAH